MPALTTRPDPRAIAVDILYPEAWEVQGRPELERHQRPPSGDDWALWLLEAGRGAGKTEACARYFARYMRRHPGTRARIIAPTYDDAVESCVKGPSGLRAMDPSIRFVVQPGGSKVIWPNGSEALVLGTPFPRDVDRLRAAGNRHLDWWEEAAANPQLGDAWDMAQLGLRLGARPHSIASTTPRNTAAYRRFSGRTEGDKKVEDVVRTHGTMFDNPHNPPWWVDRMRRRYESTRLGRQELLGELIEDVEGALWSRAQLEACRVSEAPELAVCVVAVDPAATSGEDADDTGIIVVARGVDGDGYVLADRSCHLAPEGWAQRSVRAYRNFDADRVTGETNNGGEMVEAMIRTVDKSVPFKAVHASRGKTTRAEPVSSLFGPKTPTDKRPPRFHLVGGFPELEDQLCTWVQGDDSPDRLDAMVWGGTDVMLEKEGSWRPL